MAHFTYGMGYNNGAAIAALFKRQYPEFKGKTVYADGVEVVRAWARQAPDSPCGRNAKATIWFNGDTLYSYQTVIAKFVNDKHGTRHCLVSSETYSVTTKKQLGWVWRFAERRVYVPYPDDVSKSINVMKREQNCALMEMGAAKHIAAKYKRAREVDSLQCSMATLCFVVGLPVAPLPAEVLTEIDGIRACFYDYERKKNERRDIRRRLARETLEYRDAVAALHKAEKRERVLWRTTRRCLTFLSVLDVAG